MNQKKTKVNRGSERVGNVNEIGDKSVSETIFYPTYWKFYFRNYFFRYK